MNLVYRAATQAIPLLAAVVLTVIPGADLAAQERREHVVREGDTLWGLASHYLSNPFLWGLIYEANRGKVGNPHRIYPTQVLIIPPVPPGQGGAVAKATPDAPEAATPATPAQPADASGRQRTRFYAGVVDAPDGPSSPEFVEGEGAERPYVRPDEHYAAAWLDDPKQLPIVGQVIRPSRHDPDEQHPATVHPFDKLYLRYVGDIKPRVGDRLLVAREGRVVDGYGTVIEPMGIVTVSELHEEVMTAIVTEQFGPMQSTDIAMELDPYASELGARPEPLESGPEGVILEFLEGQPLHGVSDKAFINLGRRQGVEVGDELVAFLPVRSAGGGFQEQLPEEPVARLRVVRVSDRSSTARVLRVVHHDLRGGLPVRLVAKMP